MGVSERKERERKRRWNEIIDAAEEVFFSRGHENATMDEVAEKAEVSKGTLYNHFKNKSELMHGIVARALEVILTMFKEASEKAPTGLEKIRGIGEAYFVFYQTQPKHYNLLLHEEKTVLHPEEFDENPNRALCSSIGNQILGVIEQAVIAGIEDGTIRKDVNPKLLPVVLWSHSAGILHVMKTKGKVLADEFKVSIDEIVNYSYSLMVDYLSPRQDNNINTINNTKNTKNT